MISSNLSRSMKCYLHPVLTCPLATDACLEQKKNHSTIDIIYLQLLMNFKKHSRSGLWEACENVKDKGCEPQTNHFFLKMWIKGRLIEVLVKDLENRWIVDGKKKKSVFSRAWNDVVWCNPSEAGGEYPVEFKGFLTPGGHSRNSFSASWVLLCCMFTGCTNMLDRHRNDTLFASTAEPNKGACTTVLLWETQFKKPLNSSAV